MRLDIRLDYHIRVTRRYCHVSGNVLKDIRPLALGFFRDHF
jgi:hypothetical protein